MIATAAAVYQSFLDDILANPDDDAPRLIFADWLDENSLDPADHCHAELIRVQCESESLRGHIARCGKAGRWCDDCTREAALSLREQDIRNSAGMNRLLDRESGRARLLWRRGFVEKASCKLEAWMDEGPSLVRRHPVREVEITDRQPSPVGNRHMTSRWPLLWFNAGSIWAGVAERHYISRSIYRHLTAPSASDSHKGYDSAADALADLSRACLDFARSSTV